ncbi:hypothetical protein FHW88_005230 [Mucilaginibacter sp. SG538B]|uniref:toprim domain-containing protein n=1 Tax=Mucilaginibacter sp. SG538B TaxID=2587021 RepID=UPI00159EB3FF|nr:toprim domain-containing protein [Mucilaginibacter sp. SG538B]NVM66912.1 hypothetical protein [Mucilaginibacter sp. SG538B]
MTEFLSAAGLKDQASLVDLLARLGFKPAKKSGKEYMYKSMLRDDDDTPSLSVDDKIGAWYDHGTGIGGNIIDFGLKYWPSLSFKNVVAKINELLSSAAVPVEQHRERRKRADVKVPHFVVAEIKPLGTHPAITNYLKGRGVFEAARNLMSEIYYYAQGIDNPKTYFAAGWQNENGSWEVRNRYFKRCIGLKGITFIDGNSKKLAVFEGAMDYLTWRIDNSDDDHSILILNSLSLINAGLAKAKQFPHIDIFFDRDGPGLKSTKELIAEIPYAVDRSEAYRGFKDYNAMLVGFIRQADAIEAAELNSKVEIESAQKSGISR